MKPQIPLFLSVCLLSTAPPTHAADAPAKEAPAKETTAKLVAIEPAQAGLDFAVQGEYLGEAGAAKRPFAALVVALGGGTFRAVLVEGGLPGAGWDGKKPVEINGKTDGGKTVFAAAGGDSATLEGDTLTGQTAKGDKFTLKKTTRANPALGTKPPTGALVLFDGTNTDQWARGQMDKRKLLMSSPGPTTKKPFQNFTLHLEFITPFKPYARGQERGNSGVYIQGRYEVQVLDSFGMKLTDPKPVGDICGELYKQKLPKANVCMPPLTWQAYDIDFQAAKFDATGKKTANAVITVRLNGILLHDQQEITTKTGQGKPEGPEAAPLLLQDHGNPVFFRNIWIVEK